jgi:H+-translocating NAD(P) transhydrogenase subunit alpha
VRPGSQTLIAAVKSSIRATVGEVPFTHGNPFPYIRMVRVVVPREAAPGECRVALVPDSIGRLTGAGFEIGVERGAGAAAGFVDEDYAAAGATILAGDTLSEGADAVVRVARPSADEVAAIASGTVLIGFLAPLTDADGIERLRRQGIVAFAMEAVPRITRAQSMDALSSQATVAGYKAVLIAADRVPKMFPLLMTAAGTIAPAKALVMGAGVAGLQAIATARRLGAVVSAFDVRPAVKEQVESLGATFLDLGVSGEETEGGYAKELTPEQQQEQQAALERRIPEFDIVITTALVPGRPAPKLIPAGAVAQMRPGSCIVDLAAEAGGNCELTHPGEEIVREGVTIVGLTNLPSLMASDASRLYARNVIALLQHLAPSGELALDFEDEITAGACVTRPVAEVAA